MKEREEWGASGLYGYTLEKKKEEDADSAAAVLASHHHRGACRVQLEELR